MHWRAEERRLRAYARAAEVRVGEVEASVTIARWVTTAASSIDEVLERLDEIVARSRADSSRLGYFPALYRRVTAEIKRGIAEGSFDDGARMEHLDVAFAGRYLEAFEAFARGEPPTRSWLAAFDAATSRRPLIIQHLLLGINAHINLDLGVAAAITASGEALDDLRGDFNRVNAILAALVDRVQDQITEVSPWFGFIDETGGASDEAIVNFSLERARAQAWWVAERLAHLSRERWATEIGRLDAEVAAFSSVILKPGPLVGFGLLLIRLRESNDVPRVIDVLSQPE